jgi:methylenetetrahydrofolate--tRNA-(uracil-5-)-methyltransferase
MRPERTTGAHHTSALAEVVCSNSFKSEQEGTASGLLKAELDTLGCKLLEIARRTRVPSGGALAVDREAFSAEVEKKLASYPDFKLIRKEVTTLCDGDFAQAPVIVATGPLTSACFAEYLSELTGKGRLFFYDAVAPVVYADSVDMSKAYFGGRYGKGGEDYLNLPMNRREYEAFYDALVSAQTVVLKSFEKSELFEGCMPVEEMARRGSDTIRFGPLKPVGLTNPVSGEKAYAVVQLRKENVAGDCYNMVGFQTNLTYSEQKRVFGLIPALENAEFVRYGIMHRNTYINSPELLTPQFRLKGEKPVYIAGQLSGVEGYVESIMSGLVAAVALARELKGKTALRFPDTTITGALCNYVSGAIGDFKPMNANFGILPLIDGVSGKQDRKQAYYLRGIKAMSEFTKSNPMC